MRIVLPDAGARHPRKLSRHAQQGRHMSRQWTIRWVRRGQVRVLVLLSMIIARPPRSVKNEERHPYDIPIGCGTPF